MNRTTVRSSVAMLGVAGLAVALTACGSQAGPAANSSSAASTSSPSQVVLDSASLTSKAGTAHVVMSSTVSVGGQDLVDMQAAGDVAFDSSAGTLSMTMTSLGKKVAIDERIVDKVGYVRVDSLGPHWMKIDMSKASSGANPTDSLALLKKAGDIHEVGPETVDGTATTHYAGTVDIMAALAKANLSSSVVATVQKYLGESGTKAAHIDVWIDSQGRAIKTTDSFSLTIQGQTMDSTAEARISDFGVKVNVTPPPADQVTAAPAGLFGGS